MKELMFYIADKGTCVINNCYFYNGVGDGIYRIYFAEQTEIKDLNLIDLGCWIDLKEKNIKIQDYDCGSYESGSYDIQIFSSSDLNCNAVGLFRDGNGNFYLIKIF